MSVFSIFAIGYLIVKTGKYLGTHYKAWMWLFNADYLFPKRNCRSRIATSKKNSKAIAV